MPRKTQLSKEESEKVNAVAIKTSQYQLQKLEEMKKELPKYIKKRKKGFVDEFQKYMELNSVDGVLVPDEDKIPMYDLIQYAFSPLAKGYGSIPKYSADELAVAFKFYKECADKLNKTCAYPPKIEDFCSLIDISRNTFDKYQNESKDERTREICNKIQDYCTARVADGAFHGKFEKVYSIFHQKSSNNQRDNEPVVNNTYVQNNTVMSDEQYKDLFNKYISNDN